MDIILIPGLWLNAETWAPVLPALEAAGHRPVPLTLPGMESQLGDRSSIGVDDWVDHVVAAIDQSAGPVLVVGHSAGCAIAHAAMDRRVDRVARVVHVGGFPNGDGEPLLPGLPAKDGQVPMPDWKEMGEDANVRDFSEDQLVGLYAAAIPVPEAAITTALALTNPARHQVPMTLICPEYSAADARDWAKEGHLPEVVAAKEVDYADLGGGHWPQITQPDALAAAIIAAAH